MDINLINIILQLLEKNLYLYNHLKQCNIGPQHNAAHKKIKKLRMLKYNDKMDDTASLKSGNNFVITKCIINWLISWLTT